MKGISGSLLSVDVLTTLTMEGKVRGTAARLRSSLAGAFRLVGPASAARHVFDRLVLPLAQTLDLDVAIGRDTSPDVCGAVKKNGFPAAVLAVGGWGADLWRLARLISTYEGGVRWALLVNGPVLRVLDRSRVFARRMLDVDLERAEEDDETLTALVRLLETDEDGRLGTLERSVLDSDRHRTAVGQSLQLGVEQALGHLVAGLALRRRRPVALDLALADALTIVYRILFLLFAEARGLVPQWHPVYRSSYTIEALRPRIERSIRPAGVWQALQAIARLAHRGCRAGTLRVTPFNGRLFAPGAAPLAESITIDDRRIRDALLAITTRPSRERRERISYADLGVEQLGAVYERVLDHAPSVVDGVVTLTRTGRRKATGTFYTPRAMTDYLVRRTLAPLVRNQPPEALLQLRVLDPAMGSGAFLVAACRYLADAYEQALIADGAVAPGDLGPAEKAGFRRAIAQRCLYGVDRNPTAVQLARLSLWLATLAADRPLTFLDHHLCSGNSLVGANPLDIMRQPPGIRPGSRKPGVLPLFDEGDLHQRVAAVVSPRLAIATEPDDTAEIVRRKERTLGALQGGAAPLTMWRALADAWCATWFWPAESRAPGLHGWASLSAAVRGHSSGLPPGIEREWLETIGRIAARERFFHWVLEFPEVFFDRDGRPLDRAGFDAIVGNPPWDTLRESRDGVSDSCTPRALTRFSRDSGCYRLQGEGHVNLYQLFTERALQLVCPGGRLGLLLPSGMLADHGCARLRQALVDTCAVDAVLSFENREGAFPIHRGVRFALITAESGRSTSTIPAMFALRSPKVLEDVPDEGAIAGLVHLPVSLIRKFTGPGLAIPELQTDRDRQIVASIVASVPPLGDRTGWDCQFGRELNATDDRQHFGDRGLPVLEGKLLEPFHVNLAGATARISRSTAVRLLGERAAISDPRLGYREVAASTNKLTLIAAIIPPETVTTHTIFCAKSPLALDEQWFLCGMFNSFVANYLVRLRGGTHVTASMMRWLPVPKPSRDSRMFHRIVLLGRDLSLPSPHLDAYAELQAHAARLYGLDEADFAYVLETFPLVARDVRHASARAMVRLTDAV
jgi:N-6 DNA Methylase/Eco57I restriction-modification methylase